jgi:hypothetical protein
MSIQENVTLNQKEQNRLQVLNEVNLKRYSFGQAAVLMQVFKAGMTKRLLAGYRKEEPAPWPMVIVGKSPHKCPGCDAPATRN